MILTPSKGARNMALMVICLAFSGWAAQKQPSPAQPPDTSHAAAPSGSTAPAQPNSGTSSSATKTPLSREAARQQAWKQMHEGLDEKSADRRAQAVAALGSLGSRPEAVQLVEKGLSDDNQLVRQTAASTLATMKSRGSIPKLRVALDDNSAAVSFAAAQALWEMGDESGLSIFVQVLNGDRSASPGFVHSKVHDIQTKFHDPKELATFGAVQAAGAFLGPAGFGVGLIEEMAKDKSSGARALSAQLLARNKSAESRVALEQALLDKSWVVRASAAQAMGMQDLPQEIDFLVPLLDDPHPEVRYNAAVSIVLLTSGPAPGSGRQVTKTPAKRAQ